MTKQEFDTYRFGVNTEVMDCGDWAKVVEVDFENRWVGIESGQIIKHDKIKNIRN